MGLKSIVSKFKSVKALNQPSVSIAVTTGSAEDQVTRRLFPKAQVKAFPNVTTAFLLQEIFSRHETLFGTASFVLPGLRLKFHNIGFVPNDNRGLDAKGICLGLRKGDPKFKAYLDNFIKKLRANGTLKKLENQWLTPENAAS